jgi:hypothetical protein
MSTALVSCFFPNILVFEASTLAVTPMLRIVFVH